MTTIQAGWSTTSSIANGSKPPPMASLHRLDLAPDQSRWNDVLLAVQVPMPLENA